jgi:anthranilate phosphoribosyltransferase
VSPVGPTRVVELRDGRLEDYEVTPEELGLEAVAPESLAGGEPDANGEIILDVLRGGAGPARTAVVMNAAAAILVGDLAESWGAAVARAEQAIDQGSALASLEALRAASKAT